MKFKIIVKPNAKRNEVTKTVEGTLVVRVAVPPIEGRANEKVIEVLSEYLNKPKRSISIVSGFKGKNKIIEIE
ncbi:MAG: DUF167 domain-containing protein [Bacteroidota bacterium]